MSSSESYIRMMRESLEKKLEVLQRIEQKNIDQQNILLDPNADPDDYEATIEAKGSMIEELDKLDAGFEKLFADTQTELLGHKDLYRDEIARMQELITGITDASAHIQSQEKRNYELSLEKFASVKKQVQKVRASQKVVNTYYRNMMRTDYQSPQFMDNKK